MQHHGYLQIKTPATTARMTKRMTSTATTAETVAPTPDTPSCCRSVDLKSTLRTPGYKLSLTLETSWSSRFFFFHCFRKNGFFLNGQSEAKYKLFEENSNL